MSPPASPEHDNVQRVADLNELLCHVNASWDDERRQLARQLHDSLGSSLTALTMHLGFLVQQMPPEPALQQRTEQIKRLLQTIVENNRDLQAALWNDKLEFLGASLTVTLPKIPAMQ